MARNDKGKAQECLRIAKTNMDQSDAARSYSPDQVANVIASGQLYATLGLIEVVERLVDATADVARQVRQTVT